MAVEFSYTLIYDNLKELCDRILNELFQDYLPKEMKDNPILKLKNFHLVLDSGKILIYKKDVGEINLEELDLGDKAELISAILNWNINYGKGVRE